MKAALLQKHAQSLGLSESRDTEEAYSRSTGSNGQMRETEESLPSPKTSAQWTLGQVDLFQKAALYRQLLEYKRLSESLEAEQLRTQKASMDLLESLSVLFTCLRALVFVQGWADQAVDETSDNSSDKKFTKNDLKSLQDLIQKHPNPLTLSSEETQVLKTCCSKFFSFLIQQLQSGPSSAGTRIEPTGAQAKFLKSLENVAILEGQVARLNQEVSRWHDKYESLQTSERIARKRWDRLQMEHSDLLNKYNQVLETGTGLNGNIADATSSLVSPSQIPPSLSKASSQPGSSMDLNLEDPNVKKLFRDFSEAQHSAEQRAKRIQSLEDEKRHLVLELEGLRAHV